LLCREAPLPCSAPTIPIPANRELPILESCIMFLLHFMKKKALSGSSLN
jgi:hypothetical protein